MSIKYFQQFFKETDKQISFDYIRQETIKGELNIFEYSLTKEDVLKEFAKFPKDVLKKMRNVFIKIDFKNGDINHYIDFVLKGWFDLLIDLKVKGKV